MVFLRTSILLMAVLICFGCSVLKSIQPRPQNEGEQRLSAGIKHYEDGQYKDATKLLQEALYQGLPEKRDQVTARKYLAFIYCISNQKRKCSNEFKKALLLDPDFQLEAAEAGHPAWGPVFRSVKAKLPRKN